MAYVSVLLVAAANSVIVLYLSILAVGGDGSGDGIRVVRLWGFAWIAILSVVSLVLCARDRTRAAILASVSAIPLAYASGTVATLVGAFYESSAPNSPEFVSACKDAGPKFLSPPTTPVHSLAYDWNSGYPPQINYFTVGSNGNVGNLRGGRPPYPEAIAFTEGRCCQFEGRPSDGVGPYVRHPNRGEYFGVPKLTADALVVYRSSPVGAQSVESNLTQVDVTVADRRDGKLLASLRYLLDTRKRRACGTTSHGVMDERAFVLRAVGLR